MTRSLDYMAESMPVSQTREGGISNSRFHLFMICEVCSQFTDPGGGQVFELRSEAVELQSPFALIHHSQYRSPLLALVFSLRTVSTSLCSGSENFAY
jgi:hypothetical protein